MPMVMPCSRSLALFQSAPDREVGRCVMRVQNTTALKLVSIRARP